MGPRSFERGDPGRRQATRLGCAGLQWGRALSSAETARAQMRLLK